MTLPTTTPTRPSTRSDVPGAAAIAAASRRGQGLPAVCADPSTLAAIVAAIDPGGPTVPDDVSTHAYPDPITGTVPSPDAHDAVRANASVRPGRSDRDVPKADPTRVTTG